MLNVAILGASNSPQRIAHQAQQRLTEAQHRLYPVAVSDDKIGGLTPFKNLRDIPEPVDVVTVYINPTHLAAAVEDIIAIKPKRGIFNPGSESPAVVEQLQQAGILTEEACTLVLLRTGQFDRPST